MSQPFFKEKNTVIHDFFMYKTTRNIPTSGGILWLTQRVDQAYHKMKKMMR